MQDRRPDLRLPAALLALLVLAGCARTGPPAPVVYGGQSRTTAQPPAQQQASLPPESRSRAAERPAAAERSIVVKPGDTIYTIARDNGVPLRALIDANRLQAPYAVEPGKRLVLPAARYHIVQRGDTLYGIARKYDVDMRTLVRANDIAPPYVIPVGRRLALPAPGASTTIVASRSPAATPEPSPAARGGERRSVAMSELPPAPQPSTAGSPSASTEAPVEAPTAGAGESAVASLPPAAAPPPAPEDAEPPPLAGDGRFLWPVRGRILVAFGPRGGGLHNDGINIAAREGLEIRAAESGVVAYAGNELQGFGNLLLLRHADNFMTAYGHASAILVKRGESVRRGQVIARVGRTGSVNRSQLHFEIRRNDKPVDPMRYLGRMTAALPDTSARASPAGRRDPG